MKNILDETLLSYQNRIINNPPKDYTDSYSSWSMNVIIWMSDIREKILNHTFSTKFLDFIAQSLEKRK